MQSLGGTYSTVTVHPGNKQPRQGKWELKEVRSIRSLLLLLAGATSRKQQPRQGKWELKEVRSIRSLLLLLAGATSRRLREESNGRHQVLDDAEGQASIGRLDTMHKTTLPPLASDPSQLWRRAKDTVTSFKFLHKSTRESWRDIAPEHGQTWPLPPYVCLRAGNSSADAQNKTRNCDKWTKRRVMLQAGRLVWLHAVLVHVRSFECRVFCIFHM
jgi:hypothetical protein